jgi:quercetin dioxygenase-like cupin family protein
VPKPLGVAELVRKVRDEDYVLLAAIPDRPATLPSYAREDVLVSRVATRDLTGSDALSISLGRLLPGKSHSKHRHSNGSEFYYFTRGSGLLHIDGSDVRAEAGTFAYIPPNTVHGLLNDTQDVVELITVCSPAVATLDVEYIE